MLTTIKAQVRILSNLLKYRVLWITRKLLYEAIVSDISDKSPIVPICYRLGNLEDVKLLTREDHDYDDEAKIFARERLLARDKVVVGEHDGKIVFYGWMMFGSMKLDSRSYVRIPLDTVYVYRCFTAKTFRGKRILPGFYAYIRNMLLTMGYQKIICYIVAGNIASIRSHERCEFYPIGRIYTIRILSHTLHLTPRRFHRQ